MRHISLSALVLAASLVGSLTPVAQADYFSFSVGGGGHHHHGHHHHGWGPSWGIGYYAPPPPRYVYVAPPPVIQERVYVTPPAVQERVIIQQQQPVTSSGVPSNNVASTTPRLPAPPTRSAAFGSPVVIRNSSGKGVPVAFLVDDRSEELGDGQSRTFSGSSHVVEFDRGGDLGTARYELTAGVYAFAVTDSGWELVRETNSSPTRTADRPALRKNELPIEVKNR
jgi:hypothetical protein